MSQLIKQFQKYSLENAHEFQPKNNSNIIRIMTWNVHMWTDYNAKISYDEILNIIHKSDADVIGLQEAMLYNKQIKANLYTDMNKLGYIYYDVCNTSYGINMTFSKYDITNSHIIKLQADPLKHLARYAISCEIKIKNIALNIVVTHLDVYDESENTRLNQIKQILKEVRPNSIIIGDLNCLRQSDYTQQEWNAIQLHDKKRNVTAVTHVTDYIESNGYVEASDLCNNKINMTVWTMRRVDYIYVSSNFTHKIEYYGTYPTVTSDHYPTYMDVQLLS